MAALTERRNAERTGASGFPWAAALLALVLLCLAWVLHDEGSQSAPAPKLALPVTRELPAMPNPEPMPLPAPRPLG